MSNNASVEKLLGASSPEG